MAPGDLNRNNDNPYAAPSTDAWGAPIRSDQEVFEGPFQPLRTVWLAPRATVRRIVSSNPMLYVIPLICIAGVGSALDRASLRDLGNQMPLASILAISAIMGPLGGLFGWWVGSHLIRITGAWIGGVADSRAIQTAIAWASVPTAVATALWIPQLILFGTENFTSETPVLESQPILLVCMIGIGILEFILGIWALVLLCNMIAEVQGFASAWAGLGNLLLAGLVALGVLLCIALVFALIMGLPMLLPAG